MAQRVNVSARIFPDQFGNYSNINVPNGTPQNKLPTSPEVLNPYIIKDEAANKAAQITDMDKIKEGKPKLELGKPSSKLLSPPNATGSLTPNEPTLPKAPELKKGMTPKGSAAMGAGIGIGAAAANIGGSYLENNKQEVAGSALKGAAQGASMGMVAGPIGAIVGGVVGAGAGALQGSAKKSEREAMEFKTEAARKLHNLKMEKLRNQTIGRGEDLAAYQSIVNSTGKTGSYRSGGLLRYYEVDMDEARKYIERLVKERSVTKHQIGGTIGGTVDNKLEEPSNTDKLLSIAYKMITEGKSPKEIAEALKVDEKTFRLIMGQAIKLKSPPIPGETPLSITPDNTMGSYRSGGPIFNFNIRSLRRGGPLDVIKQNVIVNGPSHDDLNKTGVKGDKGIPVVHKGIKVAEIESKELVINAGAMSEIERLRKEFEAGNKEVIDKLGELLIAELGENTYDYNKEL